MSKEEKAGLIEEHILYNDGEDRFLASAGGYSEWPVNISLLSLSLSLSLILFILNSMAEVSL